MSDPYLGEVRLFAGLTPPKGWLPCDGRILPVQTNQALASLLGFRFGGNGVDTFGLPDLRGRVPIGYDAQQSNVPVGEAGGSETATLSVAQMPVHNHAFRASSLPGVNGGVANAIFARVAANGATPAPNVYVNYSAQTSVVAMDPSSVGQSGGGQAHPNMQPSLPMTFMIAVQGQFPHRP